MNDRPPPRGPARPAVPDLSGYRPIEDRPPGAPPPIEQRFRPPLQQTLSPAERRGPRRRSGWRTLAWGIGGLGVLVVAGLGLLILLAPVGMIREQVVREVKARTGRDLAIAGGASLSIFPQFGVALSDVSLSPPPGMGGAPFVRMRRLEASVPVLPLLSRKVSVDKLVLTDPVFDLRVDSQGRRSWDFAGLAVAPTVQVAQAGGTKQLPAELQDFLRNSSQGGAPADSRATGGDPRRIASAQDIELGDVRIDNGTVRYRDERGGGAEELRAINMRITGKSLTSPIDAKGDLSLRGEKVEFDIRIVSPKALIEDRSSRTTLTLSSPRGSGRYEGSLVLSNNPQLDGTVKLDAPSARGLAGWIGVRLPDGGGLGPFALETDLKSGPTWLALSNARMRLDEIGVTGSVNLDLPGGRPSLKANLQVGALDLNPYLMQAVKESPAAPAPASSSPARPQVRGFMQRSGWSEAPIDLSGLGLLDADVRLAIAGVVYQDIKVGATQLAIGLKNRALRTTIEDIKLYGGQGRGVVTVETTNGIPAIGANVLLEGVTALPLLKDAAGFDWIDGKGKIQVAVAGLGASEKAVVESLNGRAEFAFTDGAVVGYNIPQMIRGLSQGKLSSFNRVATERTDFSEAGASFQIKSGVAETKDMRASSPLMRLTGAGVANLGLRQVDATLRPKLVGSLTGQGGAGDLSGIELPVRIRGPWERPQVAADIDGLLKNPSQAIDAIREIGKQFQQGKGGGVDKLLEQFLRR